MALDDSQVEEILDEMESHYVGKLSEWELEFVTSLTDQWAKKSFMTDKQRSKLDQIWTRVSRQGK